ncbi:hypothetical protein [Clostridium botulinum]|nr:hypothetical protein [Clostridium botulinum]
MINELINVINDLLFIANKDNKIYCEIKQIINDAVNVCRGA